MATMDVLPIHNLNRYLPVILVVMCAITALNLWGKLLNCCSNPRYRFSSDDIIVAERRENQKLAGAATCLWCLSGLQGRLLVRKEADALSKGFSIAE
ncbi:LMBR1 domain-containing protein 2, partial [Haematococcus lacustris]